MAPRSFAVSGDTELQAVVCGSQGSDISISSPQTDSVVNNPTVDIEGSVSHATQIEISVDGQYSQTQPVASDQTSFQASVNITTGTHTIHLVANDVCQVRNGSSSVVITFDPNSNPGTGNETPTTVDSGGVIVGPNDATIPEDKASTYQKLRNAVVIGPILQQLENAFHVTGLDSTVAQGGVATSVIRVGLFTGGMTTMTFTTVVLRKYAMGAIVHIDKFLPVQPTLQHTYRLWVLRGVGFTMVFASLFFL